MTTSAVIVKSLGKISLKMSKESLTEDYYKQKRSGLFWGKTEMNNTFRLPIMTKEIILKNK